MTFQLSNDQPRPKRAAFDSQPAMSQTVLLCGLDCLEGQQDLFTTNGGTNDDGQNNSCNVPSCVVKTPQKALLGSRRTRRRRRVPERNASDKPDEQQSEVFPVSELGGKDQPSETGTWLNDTGGRDTATILGCRVCNQPRVTRWYCAECARTETQDLEDYRCLS